MRLLDASQYEHVFKPLAGKEVWLARGAGDFAEHLALLAAEDLCRHFQVSLVETIDQAQFVLALAAPASGSSETGKPVVVLVPEPIFYYDFPAPTKPQSPLGFFLRQDAEGLFREVPNQGDPLDVADSPDDYLRLAAHFARVVTDRVDFAIAALGQARHVTLLPDRSGENQGIYDGRLQALGCIWADSPYD